LSGQARDAAGGRRHLRAAELAGMAPGRCGPRGDRARGVRGHRAAGGRGAGTGVGGRGAPAGLTHPPIQLLAAPAVYEFDRGVPGTLPLWRDPGFWHEGAVHRFDPARQAHAVVANLQRLGRLAIGWAPCLVGLAVLVVAAGGRVRAWRWPLFVLALAVVPLGMYVAIPIE